MPETISRVRVITRGNASPVNETRSQPLRIGSRDYHNLQEHGAGHGSIPGKIFVTVTL